MCRGWHLLLIVAFISTFFTSCGKYHIPPKEIYVVARDNTTDSLIPAVNVALHKSDGTVTNIGQTNPLGYLRIDKPAKLCQLDSTMPNYNLSGSIVENSYFFNNSTDMYHAASPNMIYPQSVKNNVFKDGGFFTFGARFIGESVFEIDDNVFDNEFVPIQTTATGGIRNLIACNTIDHILYGVNVNFANTRLEILGNTFANAGIRQIFIDGDENNLGSIFELQGNLEESAKNCFAGTSDDVIQAKESETESFDYYVYKLLEGPEPCERPNGSQTDGGDNNYELENSIGVFDCASQSGIEGVNESDLDSARIATQTKKTQHELDPEDKQKKYDYLRALDYQGKVLRSVVQNEYDSGNLNKVDELLLEEDSQVYNRAVVGLRARRGDLTGAQLLLDSMDVTNQDDQWFKDIMDINFSILQETTGMYVLTSQEDSLLHSIAATEYSLMQGYACAILYLTTGFSCDADSLQLRSSGSTGTSTTEKLTSDPNIIIYPNPANSEVHILYTGSLEFDATIRITNMNGIVVHDQPLTTNELILNIRDFMPGLYVVQILSKEGYRQTTRFVVAK